MTDAISLAPYFARMGTIEPARWTGEVTQLIGLLVESRGPSVAIGDFCEVVTLSGRTIRTQVIGFRNGCVLSMPLEETDGLQLGDMIIARSDQARVPVGPGLMGRVLDGFGLPMDGGPPIEAVDAYDLYKAPPSPLPASISWNNWSPASAPSIACCPAVKGSASVSSEVAASARARCWVPCRARIPPMSA